MAKKIKKFKDIEVEAKKELQEENIKEKKGLLKERLREIADSKKVLDELQTQYEELLEEKI